MSEKNLSKKKIEDIINNLVHNTKSRRKEYVSKLENTMTKSYDKTSKQLNHILVNSKKRDKKGKEKVESNNSILLNKINKKEKIPDVMILLYKYLIPLNEMFFIKLNSDNWITNKLIYKDLKIEKTSMPFISFPYNYTSNLYKMDSLTSYETISKDQTAFMNYFQHFLMFIKLFPFNEIIVCGHSIYIRLLLKYFFKGEKQDKTIKKLSSMNSFSIQFNLKYNQNEMKKIIIIRHGHSCHNQLKQVGENSKNIIDKVFYNANRALSVEPKLSLYGTIGSLYFGKILNSFDINKETVHLFCSCLIRTWLTILLLVVPNIDPNVTKHIYLHIIPFIKEIELGNGNFRQKFSEQITMLLDYLNDLQLFIVTLNKYKHLYKENLFAHEIINRSKIFFDNLVKIPIYIESYLFNEESKIESSIKIYGVKNENSEFITINAEKIEKVFLNIHKKAMLLINEDEKDTKNNIIQKNPLDLKNTNHFLFEKLMVFKGFPVANEQNFTDDLLLEVFCGKNSSKSILEYDSLLTDNYYDILEE